MLNDRSDRVAAFLDAWEALCRGAQTTPGRLCLMAREAVAGGTEGQREAVGAALAALGYPQAMVSPRHLGMALRRVVGLEGGGRALCFTKTEGGALWYVVGLP